MRVDPGTPVVFLHLRKTGGMTLTQIVARQYRGAHCSLRGETVEECRAEWEAVPAEQRARVRCISGHAPFGVDVLLGRPAAYFTFLRDPVERFVSAYHFYLRRPDSFLHRTVVGKGLSFDAFAASDDAARDHDAQVHAIAGARAADEPEDALERAKKHIEERFALVGLMERFDESTLLARKIFGWNNVLYMKINQNKRKPPSSTIAPATRKLIEARSARDIALYAWARSRFEATLAEHRITARELHAFQALNRCYGLAMRAIGLPRAIWNDARAARLRRTIARENART